MAIFTDLKIVIEVLSFPYLYTTSVYWNGNVAILIILFSAAATKLFITWYENTWSMMYWVGVATPISSVPLFS